MSDVPIIMSSANPRRVRDSPAYLRLNPASTLISVPVIHLA